jgi:hypothetical protein
MAAAAVVESEELRVKMNALSKILKASGHS